MKKILSTEHWYSVVVLVGGLALAILSPVLVFARMQAANTGEATYLMTFNLGELPRTIFMLAAAALVIDFVKLLLTPRDNR